VAVHAQVIIALARSKTVHRLLGVLLAFVVAAIATVVLPLIAIPLLASQGASESGAGRPTVVGEWGYPLAGDYFKSRGFGWDPEACSYCGSDHKGYDMGQECGVTVYAAGPGRVVRAGAWGGYGNAVQIDHGAGVTTLYAHMMWDSLLVQAGQNVAAGTPLGAEGTTGTSTGCHVHFEVRVDDVAVDAQPFMASRGLPLK